MISAERLRLLFEYDPETGIFTRRDTAKPTLGKCGNGYVLVFIDGVKYRAARLAFLFMTGKWPEEHVDHINGNTADDRWCNLRSVTRSQNMANTKKRLDNSSGERGISWNARKSKWHVRLNKQRQLIHGGYFTDFGQAIKVRDALYTKHFGEYARLNEVTQ